MFNSIQSTNLLDQFEPENVIVVDKKKENFCFTRVNPQELDHWLEEYSLSELWERNYLEGRPN